MNIKTIKDIAIVNSDEIVIKDTQTAIDFIMSVKYETNCSNYNNDILEVQFWRLAYQK